MAHKTAQIAILSAQKSTGLRTTSAREMQRTERLKSSLPEGISIRTWGDGRRKPYYVRFGPDKKVESFEFEGDRNDRAEKLAEIARTQGSQGLDYDPIEWRAYVDFKRQSGATLEELKKLWNAAHHLVKSTILTKDAVKRYLALRLAEDIREKSDTHRHIKKALDALLPALGELHLGKVTADMLRPILASLKDRKGKGEASSTTKRNYRKDWNTFFKRAVREKWIQENPVETITPPKLVWKEAAVFTLEQAFRFFQAARNSPIGARLAVEAFAGLRVSSSARLAENEIRREEGGIELPAGKHKLEKRYFVEGFPENLFAWLDLPDQRWDISESTYDQYKARVFAVAGLKNPGNVLRHSFCTFHIAAFRDASKTATLLTHRNPTMLYQHYRGKGVTHKEGKAYFQITPEAVGGTFEAFLASHSNP